MTRGFRSLIGEHLWRSLVELGGERRYSSKSTLMRQGEPGGSVLVLTSGRVTVLGGQADGSVLLVALRGPGDLIGEMGAKSESARTATVRALDDCTARYLPAAVFTGFLATHSAYGSLNDYLVSKLSETVPYHLQLVHFSAGRRLARLLLKVVALAEDDHPDRMRVPLSQEAAAHALGLSRSTVASLVAAWRKDGTLAAGPRLVVADPNRLAAHAGVTGVTR